MINLKALEKANRVIVTYKVDDIDSEYVKSFRKKHNLTQPALANLMGVSLRTVCRWENSKEKIGWTYSVLFTLFSHNDNLIEQIRKVEYLQGEEK
jgi:DNA-binding transcriptional regulator YiaG